MNKTVAKPKNKKRSLPDNGGLANFPDNEQAAVQRLQDNHKSFKNIDFERGMPKPKIGQDIDVPLAIVTEIVQSSEIYAALQTVYNAAAGNHWLCREKDTKLTAALAQIVDLAPQSPLEALLISQMVAVNAAIGGCMETAMLEGQYPESRQRNLHNATRLQRTFLLQIEALQNLRGKGQQTVRVEHVTVNDGGQAIVGIVEQGGGNNEK